MNTSKNHRIVEFRAANVKRLRAVHIKPDGDVVVLGGRNGQGKSSVLDAIAMALGGADVALKQPIRTGEERATIELNLGDMVVKRVFTASGSTLVVENADGARYPSPQKLLDGLTSRLTFDPLAFTRLQPPQQKVALERLLGLDFKEHDAARAKVFDERTGVNREVTELRAVVKAMPKHEGVPAEEQSTAEILKELEVAQKTALDIKDLAAAVTNASREATTAADAVKSLQSHIRDLEQQLEEAKKNLVRAGFIASCAEATLEENKKALAGKPPVDTAPIRQRLEDLEAINAKVRANKARDIKITEGQGKAARAEELTAKLASMDAEKEKKLKAVKFPVEGLSITEAGIVFNGEPFEQASSAEQIRVSVAIAAASNPNLRVMMIRDGSLLDRDSMKLLGELTATYDLQLWVERVGKDENVSVVIEDGQIEPPAGETKTETAS